MFICDACDKGFHGTCHVPPVPLDIDQNLPWVCSMCQAEGYRVQLPTTSLISEQQPPSNANPLSNESSHQPVITNQTEPNPVNKVAVCTETSRPELSTPQPQTPVVLPDSSRRSSPSSEPMLSATLSTPAIINQTPTTDAL